MSGNSFLRDTNAILYVLSGDRELEELLDGQTLFTSVITEMELLSFPAISVEESDRIGNFLEEFEIFPLTTEIREVAISTRRDTRLKLPDSIIAATALVHDLPSITADRAFERVKGLNLVLLER